MHGNAFVSHAIQFFPPLRSVIMIPFRMLYKNIYGSTNFQEHLRPEGGCLLQKILGDTRNVWVSFSYCLHYWWKLKPQKFLSCLFPCIWLFGSVLHWSTSGLSAFNCSVLDIITSQMLLLACSSHTSSWLASFIKESSLVQFPFPPLPQMRAACIFPSLSEMASLCTKATLPTAQNSKAPLVGL